MKQPSPYQISQALKLKRKPGRTRSLLERQPTLIRNLMRESDQFLNEIEELIYQGDIDMPTNLRARLFHFLLRCDQAPEIVPRHLVIGQNWIFKAQEYLMGLTSGEEYLLEE